MCIRDRRDLRLRTFVFCLRNFLAFVSCALFILLAYFSYARPCMRCVRLNGNRAWVAAIYLQKWGSLLFPYLSSPLPSSLSRLWRSLSFIREDQIPECWKQSLCPYKLQKPNLKSVFLQVYRYTEPSRDSRRCQGSCTRGDMETWNAIDLEIHWNNNRLITWYWVRRHYPWISVGYGSVHPDPKKTYLSYITVINFSHN